MSANDKTSTPISSSKQRRLKIIGVLVLLAGMGGSGLVYWTGTRSADLMDDPAMLGYHRAETRQMGILFGGMGSMIEEWSADLKRPGMQATIIAVGATLVALGCFYLSGFSDSDGTAH